MMSLSLLAGRTVPASISSAENLYKQFGPRSWPTKYQALSDQIIWHSDGIPERNVSKDLCFFFWGGGGGGGESADDKKT